MPEAPAGPAPARAAGAAAGPSVLRPSPAAAPPATPAWLLRPEPGLCACAPAGRRRRGTYLQRTLAATAGLTRQALSGEDLAAAPGALQRVDPRAKLLGVLAVLLAAALAHSVAVLVALYAALLLVAAASAVPVGFFLKRVWLFVPLFTVVVVAPATLSAVRPGDVVVPLWTWGGTAHGLTAQGLTSAALVTARVAVSVSCVVLLTLTTPWTRLLAGLRAVGVPRVFVLVVAMAYRYLFLLADAVTDMVTARTARTLGPVRHDRSARAFTGAAAGALVGRAGRLAEDVHAAMVARGWRGEPRTLRPLRLGRADAAFAAAVAAVVAAVTAADLALRW